MRYRCAKIASGSRLFKISLSFSSCFSRCWEMVFNISLDILQFRFSKPLFFKKYKDQKTISGIQMHLLLLRIPISTNDSSWSLVFRLVFLTDAKLSGVLPCHVSHLVASNRVLSLCASVFDPIGALFVEFAIVWPSSIFNTIKLFFCGDLRVRPVVVLQKTKLSF